MSSRPIHTTHNVTVHEQKASARVLIDTTAASAGHSGVARWIDGFCSYLEERGVEYETASASEWAKTTKGLLRRALGSVAVRDWAYYSIVFPKLSTRYARVVILDNIARLIIPLPAKACPFYLIHDVIPLEMTARFVMVRSGWRAAFAWAVSRRLYRWRLKRIIFAPGARFGYVSRATEASALSACGEPARQGCWIGPMRLAIGAPADPTSSAEPVEKWIEEEPFVLALGTGDPKKGLDSLLNAWREAGVSGRLRLVLFGKSWKGVGHLGVRSLIRTLQLDNVLILGAISDRTLQRLYRNAAAFVFPSWFEGLGLPPAEYVEHGSGELILRDIPVLRELYGDIAQFFSSQRELVSLLELMADPSAAPRVAPEVRRDILRDRLDPSAAFARLFAASVSDRP